MHREFIGREIPAGAGMTNYSEPPQGDTINGFAQNGLEQIDLNLIKPMLTSAIW